MACNSGVLFTCALRAVCHRLTHAQTPVTLRTFPIASTPRCSVEVPLRKFHVWVLEHSFSATLAFHLDEPEMKWLGYLWLTLPLRPAHCWSALWKCQPGLFWIWADPLYLAFQMISVYDLHWHTEYSAEAVRTFCFHHLLLHSLYWPVKDAGHPHTDSEFPYSLCKDRSFIGLSASARGLCLMRHCSAQTDGILRFQDLYGFCPLWKSQAGIQATLQNECNENRPNERQKYTQ